MPRKSVMVFPFLFFLILFSCGKAVQPEKTVKTGGDSRPVQPETLTPEKAAQEAVRQNETLANYLKENRVSAAAENGREVLIVGNVKLSGVRPSPELVKDPAQTESYLLDIDQFDAGYPDQLEKSGFQFGYFIPPATVVARASRSGADPKTLRRVKAVSPYQPFLKISASDGPVDRIRRMKVTLWSEQDADQFAEFCRNGRIAVISRTGRDFLVFGNDLKRVLFEESVLRAEKYRDGAVFSFSAHTAGQAVLSPAVLPGGVSGAARVSVFDVGIDRTHEDISPAVRNVYETAGDNNTGELTPHGTHVAGIIAGRGIRSRGEIRGVNTEALVDFYAMGDDLKGLVIPPSMRKLYELSVRNGAYIANLSWGTYDEDLRGDYLSISRDTDEFVYAHPELIVVTAVGNNGKSIASPATAKNVIAVGALDGTNPAPYSGRGNASDGRTKPELSVQGSGIEAPGLNQSYTVENGTSQAAAVLSGVVSRIYTAIRDGLGVKPTHATVKAALLANTAGPGAPGNPAGFGALKFNRPLTPGHHALLRTTSRNPGELVRRVKPGDTLTVTLAWTDPPAYENSLVQLINNFDLEIVTPSGRIYRTQDSRNNAEKITMSGAEGGVTVFRVLNTFVPMQADDVALCVKSELGFDPAPDQEQTQVAVQDRQTAAVSPQDAYAFVPPQTAGTADSGSASAGSATAGIQVVPSGSFVSANTARENLPGGYGETTAPGGETGGLDALDALNTGGETGKTGTQKVYCRLGNNVLEARAVGVMTNQALSVRFSAEGIDGDETVLPVETADRSEFRKMNIRVSGADAFADASAWTNGVSGMVSVKDDSTGRTNTFPVLFFVDAFAPRLGERYPAEGGTLTNTVAWIVIEDPESGLEPKMTLAVDGVVLETNQYDYNFGTKRLSIFFDRITEGRDSEARLRPARVSFLKVSDLVSNVLTGAEWNFIYDPKTDTTPPDTPAGLSCEISNRRFTVTWDANTEKDLEGYRVYLGDPDYLVWTLKSPGTVPENRFAFDANAVSKIGVTALDASGNESERAVLDVDYERRISPPEILITNVPAQTNAPVAAVIVLRDEGLIVATNVTLKKGGSVVAAAPVWGENGGILSVTEDGRYTLTVSVQDDDTNTVTNSVTFLIDTLAPPAPEKLFWQADGRDVLLAWTGVSVPGGDSNAVTYCVYRGQDILASNLAATNFRSENPDYGRFYYSVSARDGLGNESPRQYVFAKTDTGFVILTTNRFLGVVLNTRAEVRVPTNSYARIAVELSGTNGSPVLKLSRDRTHLLQLSEDLSGVPDGEYRLTLSLTPDGDAFDFDNRLAEQLLTVDHTPPAIGTAFRGATNDRTDITAKSGETVAAVIDDRHFAGARMSHEADTGTDYATNRIVLPDGRDSDCRIEAWDRAGNRTVRRIRVTRDDRVPFVEIAYLSEYVFGRAWDENLAGFTVGTNGGVYYRSEFPSEGALCGTPRFAGVLDLTAWDRAGHTNIFRTNVNTLDDAFTNRIDAILVNGTDRVYYRTSLLAAAVTGTVRGFLEYDLSENGQNRLSSGPVKQTNYLMSGVKDARYELTVTASDERKTRELVVDTLAPVITIVPAAPAGSPLRDAYYLDDENPDSHRLTVDGAPADPDDRIRAGQRALSVTAWDLAGNTNTATRTVSVYDPEIRAGEILADFSDNRVYEVLAGGRVLTNTLSGFNGTAVDRNYPVAVRAAGDILSGAVTFNGMALPGQTASRDGDYAVTVSATRANGQAGAVSFRLFVDTAPPDISWTGDMTRALRELPRLSVTDARLSNWSLTVNGTEWNANRILYDGRHAVAVTARDRAGNSNRVTNLVVIDRTPPSMVCDARDGGHYPGVPDCFIYDANSFRKTVTVNGVALSDDLLRVPDGRADVLYDAVDEAGNSNSLTVRSIVIDATPPVVALAPAAEFVRQAGVLVTVTEANPAMTLAYLNGKPVETGRVLTVTNEGRYEIRAYAEDKAGNFTNARHAFILDRTPPEITVRNVMDGMTYPAGHQPEIETRDRNPVTLAVKLDGAEYGLAPIWQEGSHTLEATATDAAGNTAVKTVRFNILPDCPVASLSGLDGVLHEGRRFRADRFVLSAGVDKGTVTDAKIMVNGAAQSSPFTLSDTGRHTVYAALTVDYNGKSHTVASSLESLVLDDAGPVIGVSGVENGKTYSNAVASGAMVFDWITETRMVLNGKLLTGSFTTLTNPDGFLRHEFTVSPFGSYAREGENILTVSAKDVLGREAAQSVRFDLVRTTNVATNDPNALDDAAEPLIVLSNYTEDMVRNEVAVGIRVRDDHFRKMQIDIFTNTGSGFVYSGRLDSDRPEYTLEIPGGHAETEYLVRITAEDYSRNRAVKELAFTLDRTPPEIESGIANGMVVQRASATVRAGDRHPFKTRVYLDGVLVHDGPGDYTLDETREGAHQLKVQALDQAGNTAQAEFSFTVDRTEPYVVLTGLEDGGIYNRDIPVTVRVVDENLSYYTVSNITIFKQTGNSLVTYSKADNTLAPFTFTNTHELSNRLVITAVDKAGIPMIKTVTYNLDKTPPSVAFSGAANGAYYGDPNHPAVISVDDELGVSNSLIVTSSNEGGTWRTTGVYTNEASVALNYPLDGRYRVEVYAQDIAGNSWSGAPIFTVDKILPQIVMTGISNKYTNRTVTVTADLLDKNIDPAASAVTVNGVPATLTATPTNVTASVTLSAEDRYRISVSAVDLAGNADSYNTEVNIDRTEPGGGINSPSNHLNYFQEVHFAAQAGDMPKSAGDSGVRTVDWDVIDDGSGVTTTFSSSNCDERTRSVKPDPGFSIKRDQFYEGAFTLRLRLTDWAGNAFTNSRKFVIDRTPPVVDFFADDGVSGIVSAGTNFSQDISSNKSFDVIVQAWDTNNIRKIIILEGPNSGGPMTELARWETNDDGVTNAGYTNAAPGYQTVKAERRKMDIIVEDFAGNAQPYSLTFGYTNSTPPWFTFRGETPGGAAQTVIMHDSHLVSGSDHNIFFDAYGLADLKKITVSYSGRDIQYYSVGRRIDVNYSFGSYFYYSYTDYNITNTQTNNYDINIGPDITNHNNIGGFYAEKDVLSNLYVTVITNYLISNIVLTNTSRRPPVYTNVITNITGIDYNTNFVFYGYKDGMSRVQIRVEDIFGTQWDFNRDCYVDVTPPHISIDCLENTGSTRTYRFSLSDSLSPITEKTIQWDSWTGFLHLYYQGPLWANFDWVNTFIGGHYYFWFRTSDFWNNRNDSATSNPYHFNFW